MDNDGTENGTAWVKVQAIQLLLSTCFLCGLDATSLTVLGGVTWITTVLMFSFVVNTTGQMTGISAILSGDPKLLQTHDCPGGSRMSEVRVMAYG